MPLGKIQELATFRHADLASLIVSGSLRAAPATVEPKQAEAPIGLSAGPVNLVLTDHPIGGGVFDHYIVSTHVAKASSNKLTLADGALVAESLIEGHRVTRLITL